jgi:hypothetical protein
MLGSQYLPFFKYIDPKKKGDFVSIPETLFNAAVENKAGYPMTYDLPNVEGQVAHRVIFFTAMRILRNMIMPETWYHLLAPYYNYVERSR